MQPTKLQQRQRRHIRLRSHLKGTANQPRVSVYRSNVATYLQFIDDNQGKTLLALDDRQIKKGSNKELSGKIAKAFDLGTQAGQAALAKDIKKIVFDRGGYRYHGRVKAVADGLRQSGLQF
jgi:large subunit ribosomal protein L18